MGTAPRLATHLNDADTIQRPSSDPTPTTMLPPVSLAGGEVATYEDLAGYHLPGPFSAASHSSAGEYFSSVMHGNDCMSAASVYGSDAGRELGIPASFPPSPWYVLVYSCFPNY